MADTKAKEALIVSEVLKDIHNAEHSYHNSFCQEVERRYNAYRGVLERRSKAAQWTTHAHPAYAFQIVETITANMIDDAPRVRVRPRPYMAPLEELARRQEASKALEALLRYQFDCARFAEKQRPFTLQSSVTGLTVAKAYWDYRQGRQRELRPTTYGGYGMVEGTQVEYDDPCIDVVDVRDFIWHEAATDAETCPWLCHRVWYTFDELKALEDQGLYGNVDDLRETRDINAQGPNIQNRYSDLFRRDRTKGMIEVLEFWRRKDNRVITIGNRNVLLSDRENPFWHGKYPFIVTSGMPYPFQIPGISDVEIVRELQELLWLVMNQRLDNLLLINNAIVLMRSDIDDPDSFEFAPGEKWMVDDPSQVEMWTPNVVPAEISINAEALIKGDMQNITGGMPFMGGTESQTVDQKTATGVSIVTNLAQKRLQAKRQNYVWAVRDIANHFIALDKQYVREDRIVPIIGPDAIVDFIKAGPAEITGNWQAEVEAVSDAMMRQERRAEAQALLTVSAQVAPIMTASGAPVNMREVFLYFLENFDIQDAERFLSQQPLPMGGAGVPGAPPGPGQEGPGGVTAPQAYDATSPSNQQSLSPAQFMARLEAQQGGANNV